MQVNTAVVLAGGPGDRLKPLTNDIPKALVEINRKPLLQWIIEWLRDNGVKEVILGVAHGKDKIINYFGDGTNFGIHITYSVHTVEGGTAGGFRLAISRYVNSDVFFALNGDQITSIDLNDLADFHMKNSSVATMAVANLRCPYGHVEIDDKNNISGFVEKPVCFHMCCNTGIYVFNRKILTYLPESGDIEKTAFMTLARAHLLKAYPYNGLFVTVNTYKDLIEANKQLGGMNK
jgi:NDP-sugar pyrophosphorylase family protein